jgi:hypothetical protein
MITLDFSLTRLRPLAMSKVMSPQVKRYVQAESLKNSVGILAEDAGVAADADLLGRLLDGAADIDHLLGVAGDGSGEGCVRGDGGRGTAGTTGGASVQAGVTKGGLSGSSQHLLTHLAGRAYIIRTSTLLQRVNGSSRSSQGQSGQTTSNKSSKELHGCDAEKSKYQT